MFAFFLFEGKQLHRMYCASIKNSRMAGAMASLKFASPSCLGKASCIQVQQRMRRGSRRSGKGHWLECSHPEFKSWAPHLYAPTASLRVSLSKKVQQRIEVLAEHGAWRYAWRTQGDSGGIIERLVSSVKSNPGS